MIKNKEVDMYLFTETHVNIPEWFFYWLHYAHGDDEFRKRICDMIKSLHDGTFEEMKRKVKKEYGY